MAIVKMTSREDYEAHLGDENYWIDPYYPGAEAGLVRHSPACPHYRADTKGREICGGYPDCIGYSDPRRQTIVSIPTGVYGTNDAGESGYFAGSCDGPFEPLYFARTHIGLVLELGEYNMYDDSDFYAIVWDTAKQRPREVGYATTRGWSYPNGASVDATPEVRAAYLAFRERLRIEAEARIAEERRIEAEQRAALNAKIQDARSQVAHLRGKQVMVRRGKAKGTRGELFWIGASHSGKTLRVGIRAPDGAATWTTSDNVEELTP